MDIDIIKLHISELEELLAGKIPDLNAVQVAHEAVHAAESGCPQDGGGTASSCLRSGDGTAGGLQQNGGATAAGCLRSGGGTAAGCLRSGGGAVSCNGQDSGQDAVICDFHFKLQTLISQLSEMRDFMQHLCQGNLDAEVPKRRNYIAAPLKELHTQLASLAWSMEQLAKGHVVSRLYYPGILYESFNSLIDKVASVSNQLESERSKDHTWDWSVNSWRYHQILSALNNLRIMVLEVSIEGKIVYANRPAKEYFGEIEYFSRGPKNLQSYVNVLEDYIAQISGDGDVDGDGFPKFRELFDEQNNCWYKITSDRVRFSDARTGYLHMIDNISEQKKNESNLRQKATTDPLTGVYNRGHGLQALEEAIFAAKNGSPSCAAFIDVDNLKAINDLHGHNSGDYTLRTIARILSSSVRDDKDTVCRFGGDEFIVIFNNCKEASAQRAIGRMQSKLDVINDENQADFILEFSHGIVEIDGSNENDLQGVIEQMDQIMYKNKAEKKHAAKIAQDKHLPKREAAGT